MNKRSLISNLLKMRYKREQNMDDHVAVPESQFTQLPFMKTEFDDSTRLSRMMSTLNKSNKFEPLITSVGVMKNNSHS